MECTSSISGRFSILHFSPVRTVAQMIGSAAFYRLMKGEIAPLSLNAVPSLGLM